MKIFGIAGWSGSGKTTLMRRLIPALVRRGVRLATLKHTHHDPALADPDSAALLAAGACQVMTVSPERFVLVRAEEGTDLPALAGRVDGVDLLLVEGFKFADHDKLEVHDPTLKKPLLAADQPSVVAVAADIACGNKGVPQFRRDDVESMATFIQSRIGC